MFGLLPIFCAHLTVVNLTYTLLILLNSPQLGRDWINWVWFSALALQHYTLHMCTHRYIMIDKLNACIPIQNFNVYSYVFTHRYIHIYIYIYTYAHPPPGPTFFCISLTVSLQGQPSAICHLPKKHKYKHKNKKHKNQMHWRAFSPPPIPKQVTQDSFFYCFCFGFVGFLQGFDPQNISRLHNPD